MSPLKRLLIAVVFVLTDASLVAAVLRKVSGLRGIGAPSKIGDVVTGVDEDGVQGRRQLNSSVFFNQAGQSISEGGRTEDTAEDVVYPDNQEATEAREECPEHEPAQDLYYCKDPALTYDLPCQESNCLWDLTYLNSQAPPGFCGFIQLDWEKLLSSDSIPDSLKPCVIWEKSFGNEADSPALTPIGSGTQNFRCSDAVHGFFHHLISHYLLLSQLR